VSEVARQRIVQRLLKEDKKKKEELEAAEKAFEAARQKIVQRLREEERKRKEAMERKRKLKVSGRCQVGYAWIKQAGGYRCAGGSHYMADADAARL
jgi:hypothetical protein